MSDGSNVLVLLMTICTILTYAIMAYEYPKEINPPWMIILKLWGGLAVLLGSIFFWCGIVSLFIGEKCN